MLRTQKYKKLITEIPEGFTITAHSGSMGTVQNSLESIEVGAKNADIIEFDLNFNEKNEPVLSHDAPKGGEPTLREAFEILAKHKNTKANVDLKSVANLPEIQALAEETGVLDRIFFTGVSEKWVEDVRRDCPKIPYFLNFKVEKKKNKDRDYILSIANEIKEKGAVGLNFNFKSASKEIVDVMHENGLLVSIWTVNSKRMMYKILSFGPDNITTKKPDKLVEIVSQYSKQTIKV